MNMTLPRDPKQVIEALDITGAIDRLDDNTTSLTAEDIKRLFIELRKKAIASSARVAELASTHLSVADLEESKKSLLARLKHLRAAEDLL